MEGEGKVPIICRCIYYLLCGMTLCGNLKVLKLPMLQRLCECLGFHAPCSILCALKGNNQELSTHAETNSLIASWNNFECFSDNNSSLIRAIWVSENGSLTTMAMS